MTTQRPTERAFVVQFDPVEDARVRLRGRVELVASGEATRFHSLKQLVRFMADAVRRQSSAGQGADSRTRTHRYVSHTRRVVEGLGQPTELGPTQSQSREEP